LLDEPEQLAVIRGLRDGQQDSWTALYDGYGTDVWRYVARLIGSSSGDVADVVQETFLAAARSARQFDPDRGTLWAWLTGIAHHQVSNYWRQINKRSRLMELAQSHVTELSRWIEGSDEPIELWERQELGDLVRAALGELSHDYASILAAKYLDEQSLDEIAKSYGGSVDAMKSKLARARREFRLRFERLTREPTREFAETISKGMKKTPSP
jgi:RNA polymerase sigma-70 factor (ECF subfamily)